MELEHLVACVERAGGGENAIGYAQALLVKINRLGASGHYGALLDQLCAAAEEGDFRGRVFEVNFANAFVVNGRYPVYGATQGRNGDVDFSWIVANREVYIELKLLGQDRRTRDFIRQQLDCTGAWSAVITDDVRDVARLQFDMIQKSSTTKFSPNPEAPWVNLVGVDVSELQLGAVDLCDCLLAAGGNQFASEYCDAAFLRDQVVGVFEPVTIERMNGERAAWVAGVQKLPEGAPPPREYMHGAMFLFRNPRERAALSYELSGAIVWNPALVTSDLAHRIDSAVYDLIPCSNRFPGA